MKGLIRQQISRLPFKCQASIQLAASGRKAARVEQNGTIYNQSQKSHSSAQPGVASSGSLYCSRTRETLNRLLFDDFLSGSLCERLVFTARPLHSATSTPPLLFLPLSAERFTPHTHSPAPTTENTPLPLVRILQNGRQAGLYYPQTAESRKWIAVSCWNKMCLGSRWWMTASRELRLNLWSHWSVCIDQSFFFPSPMQHVDGGGQVWRWPDTSNPWQMPIIRPFSPVWPGLVRSSIRKMSVFSQARILDAS